jgi:hypothetical protein
VKNVTISIPDDVYRAARVRAAEEGSSLSSLVAERLRELTGREAEFARLEAQQKAVQKRITHFRAADRLSRDELHERGGASKQSKSGSSA